MGSANARKWRRFIAGVCDTTSVETGRLVQADKVLDGRRCRGGDWRRCDTYSGLSLGGNRSAMCFIGLGLRWKQAAEHRSRDFRSGPPLMCRKRVLVSLGRDGYYRTWLSAFQPSAPFP